MPKGEWFRGVGLPEADVRAFRWIGWPISPAAKLQHRLWRNGGELLAKEGSYLPRLRLLHFSHFFLLACSRRVAPPLPIPLSSTSALASSRSVSVALACLRHLGQGAPSTSFTSVSRPTDFLSQGTDLMRGRADLAHLGRAAEAQVAGRAC